MLPGDDDDDDLKDFDKGPDVLVFDVASDEKEKDKEKKEKPAEPKREKSDALDRALVCVGGDRAQLGILLKLRDDHLIQIDPMLELELEDLGGKDGDYAEKEVAAQGGAADTDTEDEDEEIE